MITTDREVATKTFACQLSQASAARHYVGNLLSGHPTRDDAELLITEIATNAVEHAHSGFTVTVTPVADEVLFEVANQGAAPIITRTRANDDAEGGRGFALIDSLASRWGVFQAGSTTVVWFVLTT